MNGIEKNGVWTMNAIENAVVTERVKAKIEEYQKKFDVGFPIYKYLKKSENEIIEAIEQCIKNNKEHE